MIASDFGVDGKFDNNLPIVRKTEWFHKMHITLMSWEWNNGVMTYVWGGGVATSNVLSRCYKFRFDSWYVCDVNLCLTAGTNVDTKWNQFRYWAQTFTAVGHAQHLSWHVTKRGNVKSEVSAPCKERTYKKPINPLN